MEIAPDTATSPSGDGRLLRKRGGAGKRTIGGDSLGQDRTSRVEYSEKYHPLWARSLSRMGLTFDEVAREFGIGRTTLRTWVQTYPDLEESLREGKGAADARVEDSLFRRAVGYEYEESKIIAEKNPALGKVTPKRVEKTTRHIPPDVTAQIFWLKNRRPDLWRDVSRMEHAGGWR